MKKIKEKINIPFFILGLCYFIITFFTDNRVIDFKSASIPAYILVKILVFVIIFFIFQLISKILNKKEKKVRSYFKYFMIYFIPMFIILLLIWPGAWYGGDLKNLIAFAHKVQFGTRLVYLTSLFYSVGISLFGVLSGAIILQLLYVSIIIGYIAKNMVDLFKSKWCYLIYIPFFMPVSIFYNLYANRPILCGFTYLLIVSICLFDYLNKKKLTKKKFLFLSLLASILSVWRSELIYLIVVIPIFIPLIYKIKVNFKKVCLMFMVLFVFFGLFKSPQSYLQRKSSDVLIASRNLSNYITPLSYMLNKQLDGEDLDENLKVVDKVLDIHLLRTNPSVDDTYCSWSKENCIRNSFTLDEYNDFKKSANKIILDNIDVYLEAKFLTFKNATRLYKDSFSSLDLYQSNDDLVDNNFTTKNIFGYKVRNYVLSKIEGRVERKDNPKPIYRYTNNLIIPLVFILIIFLISIFKKNLLLFLFSGMLLVHAFIVFMVAPASYFMYYYNIFLIGMVGIFYTLIKIITNKTKTNKLNIKK